MTFVREYCPTTEKDDVKRTVKELRKYVRWSSNDLAVRVIKGSSDERMPSWSELEKKKRMRCY